MATCRDGQRTLRDRRSAAARYPERDEIRRLAPCELDMPLHRHDQVVGAAAWKRPDHRWRQVLGARLLRTNRRNADIAH